MLGYGGGARGKRRGIEEQVVGAGARGMGRGVEKGKGG